MAGIARIYMAGGLGGILGNNSASDDGYINAPKNVKAVTSDKDVQVYKWRDERGIMHFGEAPPVSCITAEKIQLKSNQNVMNAVTVKKETEVGNTEIKQTEMANPYSPQGMSQMINQTKALTESLNKQQAEQTKMLDGLNQY